ncbi:MAG: RNA methyltransferase [Clostridia bacterium]|nr:RNA methyltransferase [Clostridia bacterium]
MQKITSKDNDFVKHVKKLKDKKYRDLNNEFVVEGIKLVKEAIQEKADIKQIIICEDCENTDNIPKDLTYEIAKYECVYVTSQVFNSITEVKNPQGILAVVGKNIVNGQNKDCEKTELKEQIDYSQDIIVALDDLQDPGNLGTILRTVDSIGLTQILVSKGTADCFNPKVVRSTMGAIFRIKIIECEDLKQTLKEVKNHQFKVMVTSLQTDNSIYDVDYNKKVIVVGNEANGVEQEIQEMADEKVKIPMLGKTESLNASVATGIVLYEYVRQKIKK